jgi:hypothetical protein
MGAFLFDRGFPANFEPGFEAGSVFGHGGGEILAALHFDVECKFFVEILLDAAPENIARSGERDRSGGRAWVIQMGPVSHDAKYQPG